MRRTIDRSSRLLSLVLPCLDGWTTLFPMAAEGADPESSFYNGRYSASIGTSLDIHLNPAGGFKWMTLAGFGVPRTCSEDYEAARFITGMSSAGRAFRGTGSALLSAYERTNDFGKHGGASLSDRFLPESESRAYTAVGNCSTTGIDSAAEFINLVDCVLQRIHADDMAELSSEEQAQLTEYSNIFALANARMREVMINEVIPVISPSDIADYESVIQNIYILDEIEALQALLDDPDVSTDTRVIAKTQAENSVKDLIKDLAERAPWGLEEFIKGLVDVINEVLAVIRGGRSSNDTTGTAIERVSHPVTEPNGACSTQGVDEAGEFVGLVDCVLQLIYGDDIALLTTEERTQLAVYSITFSLARERVKEVMIGDVLPVISPSDISDFEMIIQNIYILEEIEALQVLLGNPNVSQDRRSVAKIQAENSVKRLLKDLAKRAPWGLEKFIKGLLDVINEVLAVIRGGSRSTPPASIFADGFESGDTSAW